MSDLSSRLRLPLLIPGQGQKDVTHNEALLLLDMLVQPVVLSASTHLPPASPDLGACWLVPMEASGDWAGRDDSIACWTEGGWRFLPPQEGWTAWVVDANIVLRRWGEAWRRDVIVGENIPQPSGGSVVDVESRAAITAVLDRLLEAGLIAPPAA